MYFVATKCRIYNITCKSTFRYFQTQKRLRNFFCKSGVCKSWAAACLEPVYANSRRAHSSICASGGHMQAPFVQMELCACHHLHGTIPLYQSKLESLGIAALNALRYSHAGIYSEVPNLAGNGCRIEVLLFLGKSIQKLFNDTLLNFNYSFTSLKTFTINL